MHHRKELPLISIQFCYEKYGVPGYPLCGHIKMMQIAYT